MKIKYVAGFVSLFVMSFHAEAVIIDGKFTGVVKYLSDMSTWNSEYSPYWKSTTAGEAVFGTFWYDTDLAPGNSSEVTNQSVHATVGNSAKEWIGIKIFIGGKMVDISHSIPSGLDILHREESIAIEDFARPVNWNDRDYFGIADVSSASNSAGDYDYKWLTLRVEEPDINIVNGTSLEQEFSWVNIGDRDRVSLGLFNVKGFINGEMFDASASLKLSSFSTSIRNNVLVSEPLSIVLFGLGLFVLTSRRLMSDRRR
jgi:hypothetical protein